jgi:hypothetical protein
MKRVCAGVWRVTSDKWRDLEKRGDIESRNAGPVFAELRLGNTSNIESKGAEIKELWQRRFFRVLQ